MTPSSINEVVAIVLEYKQPAATLRCIESLVNAGLSNILVWDNSADAGTTRAKLDEAFGNNYDFLKRASIVGNNINLGFSAGVNAAISHSQAKKVLRYVLLINNDATINPEGVKALLETLESNPLNAVASPKFLNSRQKILSIAYYNKYLAVVTKEKYFGSFAFLSGCCLLLDLEKTGATPLDSAFFMYGEDVALSHKLQKKNYRLVIAESALVEHVGSASSVAGSAFYEYHVARGHLLLTSRIAGNRFHTIVLWPPRLASLMARAVLRAIRAKSLVPISALWRALLAHGPS